MILARLSARPQRYLALQTSYDPAIVEQLKTAPGCRWEKKEGVWVGPQEAMLPVVERLAEAKIITAHTALPVNGSLTFDIMPQSYKQLYRYQRQGVEFILNGLVAYGAALLADDCGLGKTAQTLVTIAAAGPRFGSVRWLIVCPAVVARHWADECERWIGVKAVRFDGNKTKAKVAAQAKWAEEGGIAVCSWDGLRSAKVTGEVSCDVVLDELHYAANPKALRSKAVRNLIERQEVRPLVIGLTGTPITARPRDLFNPLDLLYPKRFGKFFDFGRRFCAGAQVEIQGLDRPVWDFNGASNLEELGHRLKDGQLMLRRVKSEVLELPERQRILIPVELPAKASQALANAMVLTKSDGQSVSRALAAIEEHKTQAAIDLAKDLLAAGKKVLLFTLRKQTAKVIGEALLAPVVDGVTNSDKRAATLSTSNVGVATIYSASTGLDGLQRVFDCAIFVGLDWVPSTLMQAEGRIHRIGQGSSCTFYYLIGLQTVDEVIRSKVVERLGAFEQVVGNAPDEAALAGTLTGGETEEDLLASIIARVMEGS